MENVELLAPAGDFETARAAFAAGADAVYCGLSDFSARAFAANFSADDLRHLVRFARATGKKVYVAFNTLVNERETAAAVRALATLAEIGPDALIVQDLGVARLVRRHFPELVLHASTQLVAHNLEGVVGLRELGFRRVVLARELSQAEIAAVARKCGDVELEVFIHGALCYSLSGLCLYGAMEKGRSGNRGQCPYCCRQEVAGRYPFSMKDLRLGERVRELAATGVASLKIEGRMKSALYVASVTAYYRRQLSPGAKVPFVTAADLETVFSRATTTNRFSGSDDAVIDATALGHLGTPVGTVKRVTKDREGRRWLRFHTLRALEKHDGLQFAHSAGGRPQGLGIVEMRPAISRTSVCEVSAGTDVEILLPEAERREDALDPRPGDTVYCSMSNAVKRRFPAPAYRPDDYPGTETLDLVVTLTPTELRACAADGDRAQAVCVPGAFTPAAHPEKTFAAVEKAFSRLGGTDYRLGRLTLEDPDRLYAPIGLLNDLRRRFVADLDARRASAFAARRDAAEGDFEIPAARPSVPARSLRLRTDQKIPAGEWDEIVFALGLADDPAALAAREIPANATVRLGLPAYTSETDFPKLRHLVKRFLRAGYASWEASDLATLRLLKLLGVTDLTADWTLYAFNAHALALLTERGVTRFVASPETDEENRAALAESGYPVAFLVQQSTPLFLSLHEPAAREVPGLAISVRHGLWITTRPAPRTFPVPAGAPVRYDLSWDAIMGSARQS